MDRQRNDEQDALQARTTYRQVVQPDLVRGVLTLVLLLIAGEIAVAILPMPIVMHKEKWNRDLAC